jgi:hypothetical protein
MKTEFKELIDTPLNKGGFVLASKILDLGRDAEIIASVCQGKVDEDGEYAKVSCSNVIEWMQDIAKNAQSTLELQMERDAR